jgi:DNA invertase Pin-like site-specific DNA recombinase
VIQAETASGARLAGRTELQVLLDFLRPGDTLVVTRIDRLARSLKDLQDIVHELKAKGIALKATEQPIDTGSAAGKAFLDMLGVFAEFETNLRRGRQLEGISAAKARGVHKGHKPSIDAGEVLRLRREEKLGPAAIARRLGIGRASAYRLLGKLRHHLGEWGRECRSSLRCAGFIPVIGRKSAERSASSALPASVRAVAGRTRSKSAVCLTVDGSMTHAAPGATVAVGRRAGLIGQNP